MKCPYCDSEDTKVIDSRSYSDGYSIKRRRACNDCMKRFTTYERVEDIPFYVVKKDNSREKFSREKVKKGLIRATVKRNISMEALDTFILDIEKHLQNSLNNEISTMDLGEVIMENLKHLDEVAYVRFASVYKDFKDIRSFIEIVENIKKR